jgi:hypothetical protein
MNRFAKRSWVLVLTLTLPGLFAAQAVAVATGRAGNRPEISARPAPRPQLPAFRSVILPADDPRIAHAPHVPRPRPRRAHYVEEQWQRPAKGDLIEISIRTQRLTAWRDGKVVMHFPISTGRPGYATPRGHYKVIYKNRAAWSSKWKVVMPWAMNWYGNYFIHQLPHYPGSSVNIGASELGRPASHGCVRVGVGNAEALYRWTAMYTPVWVH